MWVLELYLIVRLAALAMGRCRVPPMLQVMLPLAFGLVWSDDILMCLPAWPGLIHGPLLLGPLEWWGWRYSLFWNMANYLLGLHGWRQAWDKGRKLLDKYSLDRSSCCASAIAGAALAGSLALTFGPPGDDYFERPIHYYQSIARENWSWRDLLKNSVLSYGIDSAGQFVAMSLPGILMIVFMAYLPFHFQTLGSNTLACYYVHRGLEISMAPWTERKLHEITSLDASWRQNLLTILIFNVSLALALMIFLVPVNQILLYTLKLLLSGYHGIRGTTTSESK